MFQVLLLIASAIVTLIGIVVKVLNLAKIKKTKKIVYINHTSSQEFGIRILFMISAVYSLYCGYLGIKYFNDWYWYIFITLSVIYILLTLSEKYLIRKFITK